MDSHPKTVRDKLVAFADSPFTWGGIGMIFGAVGVVVSLKILLFLGAVPIGIAIVRARMFEGKSLAYEFLSGVALCGLLALVVIGILRIVPKPKEPPTAEEIANKVKEKMADTHNVNTQNARPSNPGKDGGQQQTITKNKPPKVKKPPALQSAPASMQAYLSITQSQKVSTRTDAPTLTEVVVQTDKDFPSLKFVLQCDGPLIDGRATVGNMGMVQMVVSEGIVKDHPNIFVYTYGSSTPPFGPTSPLIISLWSKDPVKCAQAATF